MSNVEQSEKVTIHSHGQKRDSAHHSHGIWNYLLSTLSCISFHFQLMHTTLHRFDMESFYPPAYISSSGQKILYEKREVIRLTEWHACANKPTGTRNWLSRVFRSQIYPLSTHVGCKMNASYSYSFSNLFRKYVSCYPLWVNTNHREKSKNYFHNVLTKGWYVVWNTFFLFL